MDWRIHGRRKGGRAGVALRRGGECRARGLRAARQGATGAMTNAGVWLARGNWRWRGEAKGSEGRRGGARAEERAQCVAIATAGLWALPLLPCGQPVLPDRAVRDWMNEVFVADETWMDVVISVLRGMKSVANVRVSIKIFLSW